MSERKRIGFLGGTFNPIHNGHLMIAEAARAYLALEEVLLIPSGCSYMKAAIPIPEARVRLTMTQLAVANHPHFKASDLEINRDGYTYTVDTVAQLQEIYPQAEIVFIVGADTLFMMETWKEPARIFAATVIAAATRKMEEGPMPGKTDFAGRLNGQIVHLQEKYRADIRLLPAPFIDISSREIRARVERGESIRAMVPETVREYILRHEIYQETVKQP